MKVLCALTILLRLSLVAAAQDLPKTSVVFIVDMSKSFAPLGPDDRQALERTTEEVMTMVQRQWEKPIIVAWSIIGSLANTTPPCPSVVYNERLIAGNAPKGELTQLDQLRRAMLVCIQALITRSKNAEAYTDISGAIALATYNRSTATSRFLVIYSD